MAPLHQRLDVARLVGVNPQCLAQLANGGVETDIEVNKGVGWPQLLLYLFACDYPSGICNQLQQHPERLLCNLIRSPFLRSSPSRSASSNGPKRKLRPGWVREPVVTEVPHLQHERETATCDFTSSRTAYGCKAPFNPDYEVVMRYAWIQTRIVSRTRHLFRSEPNVQPHRQMVMAAPQKGAPNDSTA